ncbi:response regulator, partial [Candidatus Poribacteria bacterium]|nr:response regulator [Candidatus Poribacteria bacterium]
MRFKDGWNNRILIVDDQENIHRDFDEMLKTDSTDSESDELAKAFGSVVEEPFLPKFEILHAQEGREAYKIIEETKKTGKPIAVIYMDIKMPGWDGIETIHRIREIDQDVEIVIMTAFTDKSLREINKDMKMLHKLLFIRKPAAREEIQQISISLVEKWNIEMESIENRRQLEINKKRLESVMNSTRDAIAMLNIKGDLLFANRYYGEMLGLLGKEFVNMPFDELNPLFQKCFMNPDISKKLISPILDETSEEIVELKW